MEIRDLVSKEQFDLALKEVREENWKVDMFFRGNKTYDEFPDRLKDKLDDLLLEKLKSVIRDGKIDDLLK
jgi:hypothetical protein